MRHELDYREISRNQANVGPITGALLNLVNQRVPHDPRGRTYAKLIAETMVREVLKGNLSAIKEITDRVEGRVSHRTEKTGVDQSYLAGARNSAS
jgi:hypothetical protein